MNHFAEKSRKLYCGIDLHSRESYLHVLDENGDRIKSSEIDTTDQSFRTFFEELIGGNEVSTAIEIGSLTFRYCDVLRNMDISVHVVNTLKNAYIAKSMKKTDKEDARRLAIQLWKDILPKPVHIPCCCSCSGGTSSGKIRKCQETGILLWPMPEGTGKRRKIPGKLRDYKTGEQPDSGGLYSSCPWRIANEKSERDSPSYLV